MGERDQAHGKATDFAQSFRGDCITTEWILTEVADAAAKPQQRPVFLQLLRNLENESSYNDRGINA